MNKKRSPGSPQRARGPVSTRTEQRIPAGEFKARCLELMDRVRERGAEFVVTKHRKPVARLVPYQQDTRSAFGILKGTVVAYDDLIAPIDVTWDAGKR